MRKSSIGKLFFAVLISSLVLLASACSKEPSTSAPPAQKEEAAPPPAAQDRAGEGTAQQPTDAVMRLVAQKWTGDLDGMIQRRIIRVLTTYSKTNYFIDLATQRGLVYDTSRILEDDLNKELQNKHVRVQVICVPVANDDLIPALLEGRGDIVAAGKLITEWQKDKVDFTNPTREHVSSIVVTGPGAPPITSVQDLGGKEVYLQKSSVSQQGVDAFNAMLAKAGRPPATIRPAPEELAPEDILEMVNAGIVPITITHDFLAEFWAQVFPDIVLHKDVAVRSDGQLGMMVRKNSPQLLAKLNEFVARYPEGSKERNVLLRKYLKDVRYAKGATSKREIAKFQQVVQYLRKYSDQYGLDYLLMGAQGYQESTLDQSRQSHVGAIGVMQVMPATGKDLKVGDITQLEPNVHAGVKYIRFMMDQYYKDEPMDKLNKGLFTFASYNAGPGRIKQLRERAAKRGLDPNRWFNNVELVAADTIGRETVQYVSNIYKYYLAYKMYAEQYEARQKARKAAGVK
jgi:membrane-bound lytic murein transglycosylase MltF